MVQLFIEECIKLFSENVDNMNVSIFVKEKLLRISINNKNFDNIYFLYNYNTGNILLYDNNINQYYELKYNKEKLKNYFDYYIKINDIDFIELQLECCTETNFDFVNKIFEEVKINGFPYNLRYNYYESKITEFDFSFIFFNAEYTLKIYSIHCKQLIYAEFIFNDKKYSIIYGSCITDLLKLHLFYSIALNLYNQYKIIENTEEEVTNLMLKTENIEIQYNFKNLFQLLNNDCISNELKKLLNNITSKNLLTVIKKYLPVYKFRFYLYFNSLKRCYTFCDIVNDINNDIFFVIYNNILYIVYIIDNKTYYIKTDSNEIINYCNSKFEVTTDFNYIQYDDLIKNIIMRICNE